MNILVNSQFYKIILIGDLLLNKQAFSSSIKNFNSLAFNAVDENFSNNYFISADNSQKNWLGIDMEHEYKIYGVDLHKNQSPNSKFNKISIFLTQYHPSISWRAVSKQLCNNFLPTNFSQSWYTVLCRNLETYGRYLVLEKQDNVQFQIYKVSAWGVLYQKIPQNNYGKYNSFCLSRRFFYKFIKYLFYLKDIQNVAAMKPVRMSSVNHMNYSGTRPFGYISTDGLMNNYLSVTESISNWIEIDLLESYTVKAFAVLTNLQSM